MTETKTTSMMTMTMPLATKRHGSGHRHSPGGGLLPGATPGLPGPPLAPEPESTGVGRCIRPKRRRGVLSARRSSVRADLNSKQENKQVSAVSDVALGQ
jgi:hypothetical protein